MKIIQPVRFSHNSFSSNYSLEAKYDTPERLADIFCFDVDAFFKQKLHYFKLYILTKLRAI